MGFAHKQPQALGGASAHPFLAGFSTPPHVVMGTEKISIKEKRPNLVILTKLAAYAGPDLR